MSIMEKEEFEIIDSTTHIEQITQQLNEKKNIIQKLTHQLETLLSEVLEKKHDVKDRNSILKLEVISMKKEQVQEAYLNDMKDYEAFLQSLLSIKESLDQIKE